MINNQKVLALIPARSGSKGLVDKNIRILNGRPLLGWPIQSANASEFVDKVVVSTDSISYSNIAIVQGAHEVVLRPNYLAADDASSVDVILHAIDYLAKTEQCFDYLILLEPTSPLTTGSDIDSALLKLNSHPQCSSVVGVVKAESNHPQFAYQKDKNHSLIPLSVSGYTAQRRQDLEDVFYLDGSLYITRVESFRKYLSFYTEKTLGFIFPKWKSFEIDDEVDFLIVEMLMKRNEIEKF